MQRERQAKNLGRKLTQRRQDRMRGAIEEYGQVAEDGMVPQLKLLVRAWNIPKSTPQCRAEGDGHYHHLIGRKPLIRVEDKAELEEMIATLGKRRITLRM